MKDERIDSKLAVIKKTIFIFWILIALMSFLIKSISLRSFPDIQEGLTEYSVFALSLITLIIHFFLEMNEEAQDERISFVIEKLYFYAFKIVIIATIISYFIQLLRLESYFIGALPVNSFINLFFTVTFLVYYFCARKQGIYFNYKMIENPKKDYVKSVWKRILFIALIGVVSFLLLFLIGLFNLMEFRILEASLVIGISILGISFEYLMLSIYEWNHYQELVSFENGQTILISKNYFFISIFVMLFF